MHNSRRLGIVFFLTAVFSTFVTFSSQGFAAATTAAPAGTPGPLPAPLPATKTRMKTDFGHLTVMKTFGMWKVAYYDLKLPSIPNAPQGAPIPTRRYEVVGGARNPANPQESIGVIMKFANKNNILLISMVYPPYGKKDDEVELRLSKVSAKLPTRFCSPRGCLALTHVMGKDIALVDTTQEFVVVPPFPPNVKPFQINLAPAGLAQALAMLRDLSKPDSAPAHK